MILRMLIPGLEEKRYQIRLSINEFDWKNQYEIMKYFIIYYTYTIYLYLHSSSVHQRGRKAMTSQVNAGHPQCTDSGLKNTITQSTKQGLLRKTSPSRSRSGNAQGEPETSYHNQIAKKLSRLM